MAGLFSLGGGGGGGSGGNREATTSSQNQSQNPAGPSEMINPWGSPPGVVLYRNEEVYQKGFEIWQQYVQVHHHHHPAGAAIPVAGGPPPNLNHPHFQPHHPDPTLYQLGDSLGSGPGGVGSSTRSLSYAATSSRGLRSGSVGGIGGGINCQDCGNQAKKDCAHMRCRTCCKSRGFDCPTHVKSTWVPAAKRRERQQQLAAMQQQNPDQQQQSQHRQQIDVMRGGEKRIRHSSSMSIVVPSSRLAAGGSSAGLEVGQSFPSEVSSPAVFRCVRVTSTNDTEEHLAYQTAVSIAGHVFKGILYDQGPEGRYNAEGEGEDRGDDSPRGSGLQQHNLLTGIGIATGNENTEGEATTGTSASAGDAAGGLYSTPINAFLAGTQFFPPPRS
ncbi:hypothetical protein Droror1_Dr00005931 [Drosera rotundifolia]